MIKRLKCKNYLYFCDSNNLINNKKRINYMNNELIRKECIHSSQSLHKIIGNNLKNKSQSSQDWLSRQLNDPYVKRARYENYRARSAYKLIEIDEKHNLINVGMIVIECGSAPGAWTQYLVKKLRLNTKESDGKTGAVISIDIRPIHPVSGAIMMPNTDFTKPLNQAKILHCLGGKLVDVVVSDMAPNASGMHDYDHQNIIALSYSALQFAISVLKPMSGVFLTKIWSGGLTDDLILHLEKFFLEVKLLKPDASRGDSTEAFLLAKHFKGVKL